MFSIIERSIQGFFESIEKNVQDYKIIKKDESIRQRLEEIENKEHAIPVFLINDLLDEWLLLFFKHTK